MTGNILNSKGLRIGVESGASIFDLSGKRVYDLKGVNIYRLSGELVGHLIDARGPDKRLDGDGEGLRCRGGLNLTRPRIVPGCKGHYRTSLRKQ